MDENVEFDWWLASTFQSALPLTAGSIEKVDDQS